MSTQDTSLSRRNFIKATGAGAVVMGTGLVGAGEASAQDRHDAHGDPIKDPAAVAPAANPGAYNILFILVDQERFYRPNELPVGFRLPAHERLAKTGTTFVNHRIDSAVCTSSRSVIYTGRHIQQTKMFDNTNFPWIQSLSTEMPTVGKMLREAGYYTAYKGKWHLTKEFETVNKLGHPTKIFTEEMEAYGFSDYFGVGDNPKQLLASGVKPDMRKRGAIRSIWDGRYVYARYFSPKQHNRPGTLEQIFQFNDVEVFDTATDPLEMKNLGMDRKKHGDLILALNAKMNRVLDAEVGEDRGQSLPGGIEAGWEVTPETMAGF